MYEYLRCFVCSMSKGPVYMYILKAIQKGLEMGLRMMIIILIYSPPPPIYMHIADTLATKLLTHL